MGDAGTEARVRRAGRSVYSASVRAGRVSAAAASGAGRFVHRLSGASGAGRTGFATLLELTAAGGIGDAFVTVALAGSLFFSTSVEEARGRAAFALLITIAPYAILAPFIGPLLDRVKQGNKFILMGTLLARGLLCWGMSGAVEYNDTLTLLPAAFGVLVLQKAYVVTRAAVTPRLLPREITLVSANARSNMASLIATSTGAAVALGVDKIMGGDGHGAAWVLRVGTVIYLAAMALAIRLPDTVDIPRRSTRPGQQASDATGQPNGHATGTVPADRWQSGAASTGASVGTGGFGPNGTIRGTVPGTTHPGPDFPGPPFPGDGFPGDSLPDNGPAYPGNGGHAPTASRPRARRKPFAIPQVGPVVAEAMRANAAIRVFYGFMLFFLVFILRSEHFGHISDTIALGGLAIAVAAGGMLGTGIGSALRSRAPQVMMFTVLGLATAASTACAVLFSLWSVLAVALAAAIAQTLVKVALDSILQRQIPEETRSSAFAFSETLHQLALVGGGLLGLLLSLTGSGFAGLTVAAAGLLVALIWLLIGRRRRILRARPAAASPAR
ncbi:MAG TPA: MFS transporter [Streptosporangiaceae bacterium]|jgi:MFS family permease|nr:MFS transporter [Streptosporangiaceae bacterium]